MGNPWIDHQDLIYKFALDSGNEVYQWRDTDIYVSINPETMEITDVWEGL